MPRSGGAVVSLVGFKATTNWTCDDEGRSNSSELFEELCTAVTSLIRESAHALIAGRADSVARLIMAQLAHVHGLVPKSTHCNIKGETHMKPQLLTKEQLVEVLEDLVNRVREGDSFEGSFQYMIPEDMAAIEAGQFEVTANYRIGNSEGQGGYRMIGVIE
jgi:hypothetical protein